MGHVDAAILVARTGADGGDNDGATGALGQKIGFALDDFDHANANGAETRNPEAQGGGFRRGFRHWRLRITKEYVRSDSGE